MATIDEVAIQQLMIDLTHAWNRGAVHRLLYLRLRAHWVTGPAASDTAVMLANSALDSHQCWTTT